MTTALVLAATMTIVALGDSTTAGSPAFHSPIEHPPDGVHPDVATYRAVGKALVRTLTEAERAHH